MLIVLTSKYQHFHQRVKPSAHCRYEETKYFHRIFAARVQQLSTVTDRLGILRLPPP